MSPYRPTRRCFLQAALAGCPMLATECSLNTTEAAPLVRPRKKLIGWGTDVAYPEKIQNNIRRIEELPLDGIVLSNFTGKKNGRTFAFDWECFGQAAFERTHLAPMISTLANIKFRKFTDNFLRFNVQPGNFDWFDSFDAPLHNAALWAGVAREVGAKGLKFDVEDYKERLWVYKKQRHVKTKSFEDYARQIRLRGRQVMTAIQSEFPDIVMLLSLAHSYVNRQPKARTRLAELDSYGLLPAFIDGLVEAAGPRVRLIDGQEQAYGYLRPSDYLRGFHDIKQRALELVPRELWPRYRDKMEAGVAVFANYQLGVYHGKPTSWPAYHMSAENRLKLFEQNIYHALKSSEEYVWLYSEHMGWWETGYKLPTPNGALEAIHRARVKQQAEQPLEFDLSEPISQAEAKARAATRPQQ